MPVCSELTDDEEMRHCERNIRSYWSYFVSLDFGFYRNIFYKAETADYICNLPLG